MSSTRTAYIADLSKELSAIAKQEGLDVLAYLLEMAYLEAGRHQSAAPSSEKSVSESKPQTRAPTGSAAAG